MFKFLERLFGLNPEVRINKFKPIVAAVDCFESQLANFSDEQLASRIAELRAGISDKSLSKSELQAALDAVLPEVFAIVREASGRVLNMRHFPVQLMGGMVLHAGKIAEMRTGEGKTLVATLPAILNAMSGRGVHVITVNEYLARRDSEHMGHLYNFLGLSVGLIVPQGSSAEKKVAYAADITYATNNELGFDYLRDNMADSVSRQVRREFNYAIIDEVDSVLIDEARTPLIISGMPESASQEIYYVMNKIAGSLKRGLDKEDPDGDYYIDEKAKNVILTDKGIESAERGLNVSDLWSMESNLAHHLLQALKAREFFRLDTEYVIQVNPKTGKREIVIVDEFTGRLMHGRRWSDGLHQAIEAKEAVPIQEESLTLASITFQNFFRLYPKLSGMTGTALTEETEFKNIYGLEPVPVPTHRTNIRRDLNDSVYKNQAAKFYAVLEEIITIHKSGRPVLVGTTSIEKSELLSDMLSRPQEAVKVMIARGARLIKQLEGLNPRPEVFIKELTRVLDKPLNVKGSQIEEIFQRFSGSSGQNARLMKCLKDLSGDDDLAFYLNTFLQSCAVVEAVRGGIKHTVLNAKYHAQEASIIAQAGRKNAITISTNMAGRGTDILLGGNSRALAEESVMARKIDVNSPGYAKSLAEQLDLIRPTIEAEHNEVVNLGGLHVIGTERHESRRIDNQLRGRAARQGDPGSTKFFLALDDQLMRIFGGDRMTNAMNFIKAEDDLAIESGLVTRGIEAAQRKVEAHNYEMRKRVLEYDDVQDTQRKVIYTERQKVLEGCDLTEHFLQMAKDYIQDVVLSHIDPSKPPEIWMDAEIVEDSEGTKIQQPPPLEIVLNILKAELPPLADDETLTLSNCSKLTFDGLISNLFNSAQKGLADKASQMGEEVFAEVQKQVLLHSIDQNWVRHLQELDSLREGIHLRGYANKQPLLEYRTEALQAFDRLLSTIRRKAVVWLFNTQAVQSKDSVLA